MRKKHWIIICLFILSTIYIQAKDIVFSNGTSIQYVIDKLLGRRQKIQRAP